MAKFCAQCGAQMDDDARFCGECGAPVEEAAPAAAPAPEAIPEVPVEAPVEETDSAPQAGEETAGAPAEETFGWTAPEAAPSAPVQPREKKPLPKWAKPVGIAVAAVIVVVVALSLILKSVNAPDKVADKFLDAMANSDFAALSKVAVAADEDLVLTEENTAPLFKLYNESTAFRKSVEDLLDEDVDLLEDGDDPNEGYLFDLRAEKKFLHTGYEVVIETCDTLDISSNLVCEVTLDGGQTASLTSDSSSDAWSDEVVLGPDYNLAQYSNGAVYDLLPGLYTVTGTVATSAGTTFTAETTVEISNEYNAYAELNFDYATIEIQNYYDIPVEFYIDGNLYGSMDGEGYFEAGPLNPDQMIEARADVGADEPMTETFSASEGYWTLSFVLCEVEINNEYATPIRVLRDGEEIMEVAAGDYASVEGLPSGTVLTLELIEGVTEPVEYTCEYEYDYIYPEFTLTEDAAASAQEAVETYIAQVVDLFNAKDAAGLAAVTATDLSADMIATLEDLETQLSSYGDAVSLAFTLSMSEEMEISAVEPMYEWYGDEFIGRQVISFECYLPLQVDMTATAADGTSQSDTQSGSEYYEFVLECVDGTWSVIA